MLMIGGIIDMYYEDGCDDASSDRIIAQTDFKPERLDL
jgi:hypothetical protein